MRWQSKEMQGARRQKQGRTAATCNLHPPHHWCLDEAEPRPFYFFRLCLSEYRNHLNGEPFEEISKTEVLKDKLSLLPRILPLAFAIFANKLLTRIHYEKKYFENNLAIADGCRYAAFRHRSAPNSRRLLHHCRRAAVVQPPQPISQGQRPE